MTDTNVPSTGTPTQTPANPWGFKEGIWAEDEVARLKQLAEQYRDQKGEIDWDHVIQAWGNTRTRHQILLKAINMGYKGTNRVNKER